MQQSPSSNISFHDSVYSSSSLHFSSCSYSNESFYIPSHSYPSSYPIYQSCMNGIPYQSNNVCYLSSIENSQIKHRQEQHSNRSSSLIFSARKRISDEAIERLNAFYAINKRPTDAEKDHLAIQCNITLAQVSTWFNNARSRRGHTRTKLTEKLLKKQIDLLNNQIILLQQEQQCSF
ncbi:unnamed protein product [Rotaria sp. Silwood2]|nr:unnamed protein product [Rotaria sp. Silwood2]CAF2716205.1 unnamed protein product [Rotaria sp. Silwood2]CAF2958889.1 unnamed protein product [Rotaria sp. Silwood2]CAF3130835.1 unnamed protein product [Rotaria sp. Silwood2]CAF3884220.1 unnamed protein product [Rotaria sp. Silwood2]